MCDQQGNEGTTEKQLPVHKETPTHHQAATPIKRKYGQRPVKVDPTSTSANTLQDDLLALVAGQG